MPLRPRAQRVLDSLTTCVLSCDRRLAITAMNPAAEILFEVSAKQVSGKPFRLLLLDDQEEITALLRKARDSGHTITAHDVRVTNQRGQTTTVDLTATPIDGGARSDRLIVELFEVDRFLRLAREETRMDTYAANRAVLRGLAHEIKNPLGGLRGAAQLLDRELSDRELREYTRIIIHEADRLRNLVDRMMGPYRPINSAPVNIHRILEHVRRLILAEAQDGIAIERDYDPSLPELRGDSEQLVQAVLNIVRNSAEALNGSGTIVLRTRVERSCYIGQQWHRRVIRVDIEDNGPGVPEELKERIFYPMVTGRPDGSGLGLSIAEHIIEQHGGTIELDSRAGYTRFTLHLPFKRDDDDHDQSNMDR